MGFEHAFVDEVLRGAVQAAVGVLIVTVQLAFYAVFRYTRPHVRFYKITRGSAVTFWIRNLDSIRYTDTLKVRLEPLGAIRHVSVHAGPYCPAPPAESADGTSLAIAFSSVPADGTFSIQVERKDAAGEKVMIWLDPESKLRPRNFNTKLESLEGARRVGYFVGRGLVGFIGFLAALTIGLAIDGGAPTFDDWLYAIGGGVLALGVFVLVVPTSGKSLVAGYLGWSGASKDWHAPP